MQRIVEMGAEVAGSPSERCAQVRAPDVADEQRIAGQDGVGFGRILLKIEHQDRDRFDGMAGGLQHLEAQPRKLERIAVLHRYERVFGLGAGTEMDGSRAAIP